MIESIEERTGDDASLEDLHRASLEIQREMGVDIAPSVEEKLDE